LLSIKLWIFDISLLSGLLILGLTLFLLIGMKLSSILNAVLTVVSTGIILFVVGVGSTFVNPVNWADFAPFGISGIFEGAGIVFFSYVGFDMVANFAEESHNPQRDFPIAIISSLIISTLLYVSVALVLTGIVPYYLLDIRAPIPTAFREKGILWAEVLIGVGALISMVPLVSLPSSARVLFSMSRDGLLPAFLTICSKNGSPWVSQLFAGFVSGLLTLFLDVRVLSELVSIGTLSAFTFVNICVIILRARESRDIYDRKPGISRTIFLIIVLILIVAAMAVTARVLEFPWLSTVLTLLLLIPSGVIFRQFWIFRFPAIGISTKIVFKTPLVPLVPLLGILVNVYIMCSLASLTWTVYVIWLGVGILVYGFFGYWNSAIRATPEETPLFVHN